MSAYEWLIGTRYLRSTHRGGFVSFVALMSMCGLMLGVATLIVVLSVMNGFERELRNRILAVTSHATMVGLDGTLTDWGAEEERTATGLAQHLLSGRLEELSAGSYGIILGSALAHELHAGVGDTVVLIAPEGTAAPTGGGPRMRRFRVL